MECKKCNASLPEWAAFCAKCGTSCTLICKKCDTVLPEETAFCVNCGTACIKEQESLTPKSNIEPLCPKCNEEMVRNTFTGYLVCFSCSQRHGSSQNGQGNQSSPGRTLLLVTGVLYIVFAGIGIFSALGGLATASFWDSVLPFGSRMRFDSWSGRTIMTGGSGISWSTYYTIYLLQAALALAIGVMGVAHSKNNNKAKTLLGFAAFGLTVDIVVLLSLNIPAMRTLSAASPFMDVGSAMQWMVPLGFILPVLYLVGAYKNKKST